VDQEGRQFVTPGIDKRQHRRARLVTQLRCEASGREEILLSRDISVGGMFLASKSPFPQDSEVALSFRLKSGDPPLSCRGRIVYSIKGMGMGVMFLDLNEGNRQAVQKFVDEAA
jgi:hypothetical protein